MPAEPKADGGLDAVRDALTTELAQIEAELRPDPELVERQQRVSSALAALDGKSPVKKRVKWEDVADYVAAHPKSRPMEIAAGLEVPAANVQAHLARNEGTVFASDGGAWDVLEGWEAHRRDRK